MHNNIENNINTVLREIEEEAERIGRDPNQIELCAVSKTKPLTDICLALKNKRIKNIGENYAKEIVQKFETFENKDFKVKMILPYVDTIDSVDSLKLLNIINEQALSIGKRIEILIELNTAYDGEKTGFITEDEALFALDGIENKKGVVLKGFMTMGALGADQKTVRSSFEKLRLFRDRVKKEHPLLDLDVLSMGMSSDWREAVKEGSTMIRIGTSIFGARGTH